MARRGLLRVGRKARLIGLFVPSVDRESRSVDQAGWVKRSRSATQVATGAFCREMGRSTNQGEVGLVVDNVYHAIRPE